MYVKWFFKQDNDGLLDLKPQARLQNKIQKIISSVIFSQQISKRRNKKVLLNNKIIQLFKT